MDIDDILWLIIFIITLFISPNTAIFFGLIILAIVIFDIEI
jgi:hypothetical protein